MKTPTLFKVFLFASAALLTSSLARATTFTPTSPFGNKPLDEPGWITRSLSTTDNTSTTVYTATIPSSTVGFFVMEVQAFKSDNSLVGRLSLRRGYRNSGGTVALSNAVLYSQITKDLQSGFAPGFGVTVSTNTILFKVQSPNSITTKWSFRVKFFSYAP